MFLCLSFLQEITLHAPLSPGLCGPMAGHQQEVSNLSGWHRNTAEPRQLMRCNRPVLLVIMWFLLYSTPACRPPPVGCFAKCLQTSCDITTLLTHALLSQARKTNSTRGHEELSLYRSTSLQRQKTHKHTYSCTQGLLVACWLWVGCCCCCDVVL